MEGTLSIQGLGFAAQNLTAKSGLRLQEIRVRYIKVAGTLIQNIMSSDKAAKLLLCKNQGISLEVLEEN